VPWEEDKRRERVGNGKRCGVSSLTDEVISLTNCRFQGYDGFIDRDDRLRGVATDSKRSW